MYIERIYGRCPAVRSLYARLIIKTLQYSLLRFFVRKLATTFSSLQLCPEIIDVLYIPIVPNLSNLVFNVSVVLANTMQLGKLFHAFITVLVKPNFRIDCSLHAVGLSQLANN